MIMDTKLIIFGLVFVTVFLLFWKVLPLMTGFLKKLAVPVDMEDEKEKELKKSFYMLHKSRPLLKILVPRISRIQLGEYRMDVQKKLLLAGLPEDITPDDFIAFKILTAVIIAAAGSLLIRGNMVFAVVSLGFGFFVPDFQLKGITEKRTRKIFRELPYVLDLLSLSVSAGLDFGAALAQVGDEKVAPVLSKEINLTLQEIRLGKSRADALKSMAKRLNHAEVSAFVSAMIQSDRLGVGLAETLERQSSQMRIKRFQMAEKLAAEAPIKMLFPMMIFIFPGVLIVLLGPILLRMMAGLF
jgi:tight adherence protein C